MSTVDKYYFNTKDGRTTTRYRAVVANYEANDRKKLLLFIGLSFRTHVSIKNLSFMDNEELTPNVLNRSLEAIPSVRHVSLIHCRQFNYETISSFHFQIWPQHFISNATFHITSPLEPS